jgi:hypothetical protein
VSNKLTTFEDTENEPVFDKPTPQSTPKPAAVSSDPDDIYSPDAMTVRAIDTPHAEAGNVISLPNRISVGKPSKQAYFRCNPDLFVTTRLINHESSRAFFYPLGTEVIDGLSEFIKVVELYGIITRGGEFRFWPVNVSEVENDWNDSARDLLEVARTDWVGYRSLEGRYVPRYPAGDLSEPIWPTNPLKDLLARAFRGTHTIKNLDHRIALQLLGKQ